LTRSGLTYPEVSSKVCHDSFCQLENSVSLPWVNMPVQRLKVAILTLELPCPGPVKHSGEILTSGKSHKFDDDDDNDDDDNNNNNNNNNMATDKYHHCHPQRILFQTNYVNI